MLHRILASLYILAFLTPEEALVCGADWPQWGGSENRNLISAEKNLPDSFTRGKQVGGQIDPTTAENVRWVARMGSNAYGNPTIANGRVYVGTDDLTLSDDKRFERTEGGLVKCLDEATGALLWQLAIPKRTKIPEGAHYGHQHLGTCSSPCVEGDRVYVVTGANEVVCLDAQGQANGNDGPFMDEGEYQAGDGQTPIELTETDADILWCYDLIDDLGACPHDAASCSILIHKDLLYLSTSNGVEETHTKVVAPDAPAFVALDKWTGRLAAVEKEGISARLYHAQWCSPSAGQVGDQTLIFLGGGDGVCYAFRALDQVPDQPVPLELVWSYDANPPEYKYRDDVLIPYYDGDRRKHGGPNKDDGMYVGPSQIIATPVFYQNRVYVAIGQDPAHGRGKGMLHCIDATQRGNITESGCLWRFDGLDRTMATVAIADGKLYIPDIAGRLFCLDAETGALYWEYDTKAETWGGPLLADHKIFLATKRKFFILEQGDQPKMLSEVSLGSPAYSTPVAANGVVYVTSQKYLWAVAKNPANP
ncbi:MAG: PQQ-binding-like beta-propeller repeat protein [Pirellulales bacterium]|nr:PQQ-binding-like beta-propeller repeat protein [Pirellulales bacterium]